MRLDVYLTPGEISPADLADREVVVIDILRATSSIVQALSAGARSIYPVSSIEEALRLANTFGRDEVLLCGERRCMPIEGFDLGNSPREFTPARVGGKTLVMSTTNGTGAISLTVGASRVYIGSLLNLAAVVDELVRTGAEPVFLCSGRERNFAIEDAICAGLMVRRLTERSSHEWAMNDGALAAVSLAETFGADPALFRRTAAGQAITEAGLEEDLEFCARVDVHQVIPVVHDRNITAAA
jgi:2-phosphosulfolactate phosphatase